MVETKYSELIAQYLSKDITMRNKEKLMAWVKENSANKAYFDELTEIWNHAEHYEAPLAVNADMAWDKLEDLIDEEAKIVEIPNKTTRVVSFRKKWWSVAAAIALLVSVGLYWWNSGTASSALVIVQTENQEQQEHLLPDGSQVWLNGNSKLTYDKAFNTRIVQLEGEAFFDVIKKDGALFEIVSGEAKTIVLGTSFNVRAYPEENRIEVTVETGVVELQESEKATNKINIAAGKSGYYDKQTEQTKIKEEKVINAPAWKTKELVFDEVQMESIITALERYFDINIEVENKAILNCNLNGKYPNPNLEDMINIMSYALDLKVEHKDSMYYISGTGCSD